ncbi:hypothetical protein MUK70_06465 [Dyadobacter chenwenxiniae]|uniref:Uncharacterized protein n=1 Tax=Dyadobacter chenwenxiniae TaxID=2906456 RepID=A0A9X1TP17_9BACT|nr:hypothetical protein [Dyadobacter chenwenxiniae]MCF0065098.1 hypothetical protein [Dyadobacter chenwenxiniae]UON84630.1 hypothetical protein MUK70_06465 [Dyadobacter chenwenxiniae]
MRETILEFPDQDLTDEQIRELLYDLTGETYRVLRTDEMYWGEGGTTKKGQFYHLMPVLGDNGFYAWYSLYRQHNQRFESKANAVLHFTHYWTEWRARIKAKQ